MILRLVQMYCSNIESDIPQYANLNVGTSRNLKRFLSIIAESVPFKPNFSKIPEMISVSRNSLDDYFSYMEKAGLIGQLRNETSGIQGLGKADKVYLEQYKYHFQLGWRKIKPWKFARNILFQSNASEK